MRLRALAPGKVNLCLRLGPTRADGRHELVTVFQSVSLADELVLETLGAGATDLVRCPGVEGENLAARALAALRARGWDGPPVRIEITKRVPVAAGMGGGSADAAATLRLAGALVPVADSELAAIAAGLGADVPAALAPGIALGTGAGEELRPLPPIAEHAYVIVPAGFGLSTPQVFARADGLDLPRGRAELAEWQDRTVRAFAAPGARPQAPLLANDLEPAARALAPGLAATLDAVRAVADHGFLCGSGPTVAGLFWGPRAGERASGAARALGGAALVALPVGTAFGAPSLG